MTEINAVSLFSGCGGLDLGFQKAGVNYIFGSDVWTPAGETYRENFDHRFVEKDIQEFSDDEIEQVIEEEGYSMDDVNIVTGSPPCKGLSRLNNERIALDEIEKDDRNLLFMEFLRIVDKLNPEVVVMENVDDLSNRQTSDGRYLVDIIEQEFNRKGYKVEYRILDAEKYGVPQKRSRMIFIGYRKSVSPVFPRPTHTQFPETAGEKLSDIDSELPNMDFYDEDEETVEKMKHIPQGGYYKDLPYELKTKKYRCNCEDKDKCPHDKQVVQRYGTYLRRIDPDEPSLTVSNNPLIHPTENRYVTPREKARLQTFPDDFKFKGTKDEVEEQIGNAVPVKLGEVLAEHLVDFYPEIRDMDSVEPSVDKIRSLSEL